MLQARDYQISAGHAIDAAARRVRRILAVAPCGAGKCLGLGTPVLMYDGRIVPVEDVERGDLLMGPDSHPREVLSTTRGEGQLYRIDPLKGSSWVCNDAHILTLVDYGSNAVVDIELQRYLASSEWFRARHKQFSPAGGIDFAPAEPLPLDPYFLGVWYGDGTKALNGVAISKPDIEILDLCREMAARFGLRLRTDGKNCPTHHIHGLKGRDNPLLDILRGIVGDGTRIHRAYLTSSRSDRMAFLAGFLDTDGYMDKGGFEIAQKVKGFSEGIAFVARSLGLRALVTEKVVNDRSYWRVSISGDMSSLPIRIPRKRPIARKINKVATRTGFSVSGIGHGQYAGFAIDGDGRFLLGDFTVTHNTIVAAQAILGELRRGHRSIFAAPRKEIVNQTYGKLLNECGVPQGQLSVMMADDPLFEPEAAVQVASLDTLRRRVKVFNFDPELLVFDESHRNIETIAEISELYPFATVLLLTATPWRVDGRGLGEIADELVVVATVKQLQDQGHLAQYEAWSIPREVQPSADGLRRGATGDFFEREVAERSIKKEILGDLPRHWLERARGLPTIAFAVNVEHSKAIVQLFNERGIRAEHIDANSPASLREEILGNPQKGIRGRLEKGETPVVCNVGIAEMGLDIPAVKCEILAAMTASLARHIQQTGRGLRPFQGQRCIFLDHAGNFERHCEPAAALPYSLDGVSRSQIPKSKRCAVCYAIFTSQLRACPRCGHVNFVKPKNKKNGGVENPDGTLIPFIAKSGESYFQEQQKHWSGLRWAMVEFRRRLDWAIRAYQKRWNVAPPEAWLEEERSRRAKRAED